MTIGQKIRASRKRREWTQTYLGEVTNLAQSAISTIEKNELKGGPDPETILKIASALNDDTILLHYIESNPVYQYVIPKIFPNLNSLRRDPSMTFTRLAEEAQEVLNASRIMAGLFRNANPTQSPDFEVTFKSCMKQMVSIKRAVDILEFELLAVGVITKAWLDDVYERQQHKQ